MRKTNQTTEVKPRRDAVTIEDGLKLCMTGTDLL